MTPVTTPALTDRLAPSSCTCPLKVQPKWAAYVPLLGRSAARVDELRHAAASARAYATDILRFMVLFLLFVWLTTSAKNKHRMCRCVCHLQPDDLRLSGERSAAERVRWCRGWSSGTMGRNVTLATALLNAGLADPATFAGSLDEARRCFGQHLRLPVGEIVLGLRVLGKTDFLVRDGDQLACLEVDVGGHFVGDHLHLLEDILKLDRERHGGSLRRDEAAAGDGVGDQSGVVAAVFDEDSTDFGTAEDGAGEVEVGDVGLEGLEIMGGDAVGPFEEDAAALEEGEVGLVADQREDGVRAERLFPGGTFDENRVAADLLDACLEERADLPGADAVLQVRLDPVLDSLGDRWSAGDEGDTRAMAVEVEGRLGGGVA